MDNREAYDKGFLDGLSTYSWMKSGETFVGTCGKLLKDAKATFMQAWNYLPPKQDEG